MEQYTWRERMSKIDLYNGDCLEVMDRLIADGVVADAIITDPPYNTTACHWDKLIPFDAMWERLNKLIKPNGAIVLFGSEPFSSALRMSNIKNYKYDWKWDKDQGGNFANAKRQPMKTYEDIIVFNSKIYYPIMTNANEKNIRPISDGAKVNITGMFQKHSKDYDVKKRYPKAILSYSTNMAECNKIHRVHPTQKPVALMEYLIKTYTNENEVVLDFTMGSGSTIVAAKNTNRRAIGIELDENYFNIAKERIETTNKEKE
jgi:site-specific DNA-methyltransferase (adenine-specific)